MAQTIFLKNGQVNHTLLPDGTPCSGSSEEVRREAQIGEALGPGRFRHRMQLESNARSNAIDPTMGRIPGHQRS